jgi:hypothetical protein
MINFINIEIIMWFFDMMIAHRLADAVFIVVGIILMNSILGDIINIAFDMYDFFTDPFILRQRQWNNNNNNSSISSSNINIINNNNNNLHRGFDATCEEEIDELFDVPLGSNHSNISSSSNFSSSDIINNNIINNNIYNNININININNNLHRGFDATCVTSNSNSNKMPLPEVWTFFNNNPNGSVSDFHNLIANSSGSNGTSSNSSNSNNNSSSSGNNNIIIINNNNKNNNNRGGRSGRLSSNNKNKETINSSGFNSMPHRCRSAQTQNVLPARNHRRPPLYRKPSAKVANINMININNTAPITTNNNSPPPFITLFGEEVGEEDLTCYDVDVVEMDCEPIIEEEIDESLLHRTAASFPAATANSDSHFINGTSSNSNWSSSISNINNKVSSGSRSSSNNSVVTTTTTTTTTNMSIEDDDEDDEDNGNNYYFSLPVDFGRRSLEGTDDVSSLEYSGSGDYSTLIGEEISIISIIISSSSNSVVITTTNINMSFEEDDKDDDDEDDDNAPTTTDDEDGINTSPSPFNNEANEPTGGASVAPEELLFGSIWVHHPKHGMVRRSARLIT